MTIFSQVFIFFVQIALICYQMRYACSTNYICHNEMIGISGIMGHDL